MRKVIHICNCAQIKYFTFCICECFTFCTSQRDNPNLAKNMSFAKAKNRADWKKTSVQHCIKTKPTYGLN